ncbi:MAG: LysR family transcriptional regulator [Alphaproteobacteria bacterium]|nr:LysR family transcriptional regulator [Alphaproteobacteria bacterium]
MSELNLNRADLNLLVVFDAVARTRSVTAAAERLSLSQPAVSHALKRLRGLMRDPLFVRGRDGLVLTPRAEARAPEIAAILGAVGRVLATESFDPATTTRTYRLAASDYATMTVIPSVVGRLRTAAPHAGIDVYPADGDLLPRLERGEVDVAFVGVARPGGRFVSHELFREHFVGLVCERHPLAIRAGQGRLTLKDYLAYPHVVVTLRNPRQSPIDAKLAKLGRTRRVAMVTPNFAANIASLRGTDLIMSLPSRLVSLTDRHGLILFELPLAVPDYPYFMSWHRRTDDDPAMVWLRGQVIEAFRSATGATRVTARR